MRGFDSRFVFFVVIVAALCAMAALVAGAVKFYDRAIRPLLDALSGRVF